MGKSTSRSPPFSIREVQVQVHLLVRSYQMLIQTKRQVFYKEKMAGETDNHIVNTSIDETIKQIEIHLTKFAVQTIFSNQSNLEIMWPPQLLYQSDNEGREQVKKLDELGISFGLVYRINNNGNSGKEEKNRNLQFLHRTFAEYLLAKYLYQGFSPGKWPTQQVLGKRIRPKANSRCNLDKGRV